MEKEIVDCADSVYQELGVGFSEVVYHRALEVEFRRRHIMYETHPIVPILYAGFCVGYGEADIIVFNNQGVPQYVVELKAIGSRIARHHQAQIHTYLRGRADIPKGLIINFSQSGEMEHFAVSNEASVEELNELGSNLTNLVPAPDFEEHSNPNNHEEYQPKREGGGMDSCLR